MSTRRDTTVLVLVFGGGDQVEVLYMVQYHVLPDAKRVYVLCAASLGC